MKYDLDCEYDYFNGIHTIFRTIILPELGRICQPNEFPKKAITIHRTQVWWVRTKLNGVHELPQIMSPKAFTFLHNIIS